MFILLLTLLLIIIGVVPTPKVEGMLVMRLFDYSIRPAPKVEGMSLNHLKPQYRIDIEGDGDDYLPLFTGTLGR